MSKSRNNMALVVQKRRVSNGIERNRKSWIVQKVVTKGYEL